jgi:hypothetical protein
MVQSLVELTPFKRLQVCVLVMKGFSERILVRDFIRIYTGHVDDSYNFLLVTVHAKHFRTEFSTMRRGLLA